MSSGAEITITTRAVQTEAEHRPSLPRHNPSRLLTSFLLSLTSQSSSNLNESRLRNLSRHRAVSLKRSPSSHLAYLRITASYDDSEVRIYNAETDKRTEQYFFFKDGSFEFSLAGLGRLRHGTRPRSGSPALFRR